MRAHDVTVIDGIYRTLDTVPEQDLKLMEIWLNVLQNAGVGENDPLVTSIRNWKEGRKFYDDGEYVEAVDALSTAVVPDHTVIYYDRALSLIKQEDYAGALSDLNTLMEFAIRVIPTPTPEATIKASPSFSRAITASVLLTETDSPLSKSTPTMLPMPADNAQVSSLPYTVRDYRRRFNNLNSIISLVEQTLERNPPLFNTWQISTLSYPNLQSLALSDLAASDNLSTGIAPGCLNLIEGGTFEQFNPSWQIGASTRPPMYSNEQTFNGSLQALRLGNGLELPNIESVSEVRHKPILLPFGADRIILRFLYYPFYDAAPGEDLQQADLFDATTDQFILSLLNTQDNARAWKARDFDLTPYAGRSVSLRFRVRNDGGPGRTLMYLDNVELEYCAAPFSTGSLEKTSTTPSPPATDAPPIIRSQPIVSATVGTEYAYIIEVQDDDSNIENVQIVWLEKPDRLEFIVLGPGFAELRGTPRDEHAGTVVKVRIAATDGISSSPPQEFDIMVTKS